MPLSNLPHSITGTCPCCNQKADILSREHLECRCIHQAGWHKMVRLSAQAAGSPDFDETQLRLTMAAVAQHSYGNGETVNQALEARCGPLHGRRHNHPRRGSPAQGVPGPASPAHRHRRLRGNGPPRQGVPRPADAGRPAGRSGSGRPGDSPERNQSLENRIQRDGIIQLRDESRLAHQYRNRLLCDTSPEQLARTFTLANDLSGGTLLLRPTGMFCRRP